MTTKEMAIKVIENIEEKVYIVSCNGHIFRTEILGVIYAADSRKAYARCEEGVFDVNGEVFFDKNEAERIAAQRKAIAWGD